MITDLLLDFDDTLYDTHGNAILALSEVFDRFRLGRFFDSETDFTVPYWQSNQALWAQYAHGQISREDLIVRRFMEPLEKGHDCHPTVEQVLEISDYFLDRCSVKTGVVEGAFDFLDALKGKCRLHIASNGFHEVQYRKIHSAGFDGYFDTIILSEDAGANKPSQQFFDYALSQIGVPASQCLMLGDNLDTDILGASQAGIRQIFFNRHPEQSTSVTVQPTFVVHSLNDALPIIYKETNKE